MEERDALLESFCELSSLPEFSERCGKEEQKSIRERERERERERSLKCISCMESHCLKDNKFMEHK